MYVLESGNGWPASAVYAVDVATLAVVATFPLPGVPGAWDLAAHFAGRHLFVPAGATTVLDGPTGTAPPPGW